MDVYVDYSCEDNSETGRTKLTVSDFDTTSIRDVKFAIQDAIQAPVCDQQLFYQGQPVTDDDMPLSRLYFQEGDCFKLQFLAAADITRMREQLDVLKNSSQKIFVEKLQGLSPSKLCSLSSAIEKLSCFFLPWNHSRTVALAQRHFFVQEGGFDALMEVLKFSWPTHLFERTPMLAVVNPGQVFLFEDCLNLLWNFGETIHDQKFILSKGVLCLYIDAVLLQPDSCKVYIDCTPRSRWDTVFIASDVTPGVNEAGIRCLSGLIEYDAETQEKVSKMSPLIDKLLSMTDGYSTINSYINSYQITYSLSSRQVASKSLFHCTYNVKSAQPLVDCGALAKMIKITKKVLIDNDSDVPLRYFCCLFLARLRSAPLVTLDRDTCVAIDKLIDMFLNRHVPNEILKWEEKKCAIWMTIVPLVHLAFAAGKQYYSHSDMNDNKQHGYQISAKQLSEEACFIESYLSKTTVPKVHEAKSGGMKKSQGTWSSPYLLDSDSREENVSSESRKITTSFMSENDKCVKVCRKDQLTWPGSTSAQKLGIFSLVHTLAIKENLQTALSENLLPYLVCLSWHLRCDEREQLRASLANFHNDPAPPSLKVAAKSVLAIVYGLDMVFNL